MVIKQVLLPKRYTQWGKTDYGDFGNSWTSTLAPDNEYEYYAACKPAWGQPTSSEEYVAANYFNINGRRYIPYLPGWSFYLFNDEGFWVNALSAGVDCLGFVMRAADYDGNRYRDWRKLDDHTVDYYKFGEAGRVFPRQDHNCIERVVTSSNTSSNRAAVVPGDIFYIKFDANNEHIAIVRNVTFSGNTRAITTNQLDNIEFIESTWETGEAIIGWAKVVNDRNDLRDYNNTEHVYWHIVRLRLD